jgi:hypothetical protein
MVHNVADVVVDQYLRLKQLAPDCTVKELVTSVENMFCSKFVLDSKSNTVRWVLWNDCLREAGAPRETPWPSASVAPKPYVSELLPYVERDLEVSMQDRRAIKLTIRHNAKVDNLPPQYNIVPPEDYFPGDTSKNDVDDEALIALKGNPPAYGCFPAVAGGASEDMPIASEQLPLVFTDHGFFSETIDSALAYCFGLTFLNSLPPKKDDGTEGEDKASKRPLAFANYYYNFEKVCHGDVMGFRELNTPTLILHIPEGLFNTYHRLRNALLSQGVYNLTVTLDSSITINENELYLFDGQPVMVESVLETLGASTQVVKLQTIKIADDNNE